MGSLALADDNPSESEDAVCETVLVEQLGGSVTVESDREFTPVPGDTLGIGDTLKTGAASWADLRLCDGSGVRVAENSHFQFAQLEQSSGFWNWAFCVTMGSIRAIVQSEPGAPVKFRVRTPTAAMGIRGTEFVVDVNGLNDTKLHTLEGTVMMGPYLEWNQFNQLQRTDRFVAVSGQQSSAIERGQGQPEAAQSFDKKT
jgi:ferric-dicitrate binding protein FerR (iron transport regulator)